jgi:hypothetical protein
LARVCRVAGVFRSAACEQRRRRSPSESAALDRWAAADLLREVCSERFGSVEHAVAAGLALRYDGEPCFRSDH